MHAERKLEQLKICLDKDVRSMTTTGLERYRLLHCALPEMSLEEVETSTSFLGHRLCAPLLISAMTGGVALAGEVNRRLALAAQELGLAMCLGSQRAAVEDPSLLETYQVRQVAPDILLFANLGAVQLNYGYGVKEYLWAVESVRADALVLHLNPLQEALQAGGNTDFAGLLERITAVCRALPVPVIVKEVGGGISAAVAERLRQAGVAALDLAGAGGTSWSEVERHRSTTFVEARVAEAFADWGIPTADALVAVRQAHPDLPLIASGGIKDGVEVAKCLALGANLVGIAQPLLRSAMDSSRAVSEQLRIVIRQLRVAMFCVGARTIADLDSSHLVPKG